MNAVKVNSIVQKDGELQLTNLPVRKGDQVEATLVIRPQVSEQEREQARQRLIEIAKTSKFRSTGPYPSRDELHDRS
jgi:hypothetical protein